MAAAQPVPTHVQARWIVIGSGVALLAYGAEGFALARTHLYATGPLRPSALVPGSVFALAGFSTLGVMLWVYVLRPQLSTGSLVELLSRRSSFWRVSAPLRRLCSATGFRELAATASLRPGGVAAWLAITLAWGLSGLGYFIASHV